MSGADNEDKDDDVKRREYPRWQLSDDMVPLQLQSKGLPAQLWGTGLLFNKLIGQVVIKDLSMGGAGLLAPSRYRVPNRISLVLEGAPGLAGEVMHRREIGPSLVFYGVRWRRVKHKLLLDIVGRFVRESGDIDIKD